MNCEIKNSFGGGERLSPTVVSVAGLLCDRSPPRSENSILSFADANLEIVDSVTTESRRRNGIFTADHHPHYRGLNWISDVYSGFKFFRLRNKIKRENPSNLVSSFIYYYIYINSIKSGDFE